MDQFSPIPMKAEDILHEVFDQSAEGFQVIDRNWRYLFVNAAVASQGKSTPEQLAGRTMMEAYPGIDKTPLFAQLKRSMDEKVSIRMENEFNYPDGSKGWFQLFIHPWGNGIMIFSVDITSRKLAEEQLAAKINGLNQSLVQTEDVKKQIEDLKHALDQLRQQEPQVV